MSLATRDAFVVAFFSVFLLAGLYVLPDYGAGFDEHNNYRYGTAVYEYVFGMNPNADYMRNPTHFFNPTAGRMALTHGPVFEVLIVFIGKQMGFKHLSEFYPLRHASTFMLFYLSTIVFYLLCKSAFKSWSYGLMGCLMLVLSPAIFPHTHYNSVDVSFMSVYLIAMYSLNRFLGAKTIRWAVIHGIISAVLIDIRIAGLIIPAITIALSFTEHITSPAMGRSLKKYALMTAIYLAASITLVILLWPALWHDPVGSFLDAFKTSANDVYPYREQFMGKYVRARDVPWYFTPVWIAVSTPPAYTLLFMVGLLGLSNFILRRPSEEAVGGAFFQNRIQWIIARKRAEITAFLCFFGPLFVVAAFKSTLFNGWRHMFFVYPAFLTLSVAGISYIHDLIYARLTGRIRMLGLLAFYLMLVTQFISVSSYMVYSHPHQSVYFNSFVGGVSGGSKMFGKQTWASQWKEAFQTILKTSPKKRVNIVVFDGRLGQNTLLLKPSERDRILLGSNFNNADYAFGKHSKAKEILSREIDGVAVWTVSRMR